MAENLFDLKEDKIYWQRLLRLAGLYHGRIDGIIGTQSRGAALLWQEQADKARSDFGTFDERSERNILTLVPSAQAAARQWLALAKKAAAAKGYDIRIICGTRTYGEQDALFNKRPRVTKARGGRSWHNFGLAWDFGVFQGKHYLDESPIYELAGRCADKVKGVEWGGDWTAFVDRPHLQLALFRTTTEARKAFEA